MADTESSMTSLKSTPSLRMSALCFLRALSFCCAGYLRMAWPSHT